MQAYSTHKVKKARIFQHVEQGWHIVGGKKCFFRSKMEKNYALYLEWLKRKNKIIDWAHESRTFWFEAIKRGVRSYKPDFEVLENNGTICYHETKGYFDAKSKTKIKRMKKYYPEINLIVIDGPAYKRLSTQVRGLIPGW